MSTRKKSFWLFWVLVSIGFFLVFTASLFKARERVGWNGVVRSLQNRNFPIAPKDLNPEKVPDEENAAAHPLFATQLNYTRNTQTGQVIWQDGTGDSNRTFFSSLPEFTGRWDTGIKMTFEKKASAKLPNATQSKEVFNNRIQDLEQSRNNSAASYLQATEVMDSLLEELLEVTARPRAQFPIKHEEGYDALLTHMGFIRNLSKLYAARSSALLVLEKTEEAGRNLQLALQISEMVREDSTLIGLLVRIASNHAAMQPLWEGLQDHRWNREQLNTFLQILEKVDFFPAYGRAMNLERVMAFQIFDRIREKNDLGPLDSTSKSPGTRVVVSLVPGIYFTKQKVKISEYIDRYLLPAINLEKRVVDFEKIKAFDADLQSYKKRSFSQLAHMGPLLLLPALSRATERVAAAQAKLDLAKVAIALELHYLEHQGYPEQLSNLVPTYLKQLPHDSVTGEPLRYQKKSGNYLLYQVGKDGKDDGGFGSIRTTGSRVYENGDWPWPNGDPEMWKVF